MRKYSCTLFIKYNHDELLSFIKGALINLGFPASLLYIKTEQSEDEIPFNENDLFVAVANRATMIWIMNKEYDENEDFYWFKSVVDESYNVLKLEWRNSNLDFLLSKDVLSYITQSKNFISGYFYDVYDEREQSLEEKQSIQTTDELNPDNWKQVFEKIDISNNWGRSIDVCGLKFMAAPQMWFGETYFNIISLEKLIKFKYSSLIKYENANMVSIRLFDISDQPSNPENRKRQQEYWDFFDLKNIINRYTEENEIDTIQAIKNKIYKLGKKRR